MNAPATPTRATRSPNGSALNPIALVTGLTLLLFALSASSATYYWDNNGTTAGFGSAGGTWAAPTVNQWSTDGTGVAAPGASITTATGDALNFGNGATGLGAGTITVNTVSAGNMTFASGSGAISLSGGTITLAAAETITLNNASDTISSALAGAGTSLTKNGTGALSLSGGGTISGTLLVSAGTLNITGGTLTANGGFSAFGNTASTAGVVATSSGATLTWGGANGGNFGGATSASGVLYNVGTYNVSGTTANNCGIYLGNGTSGYGYIRNTGTATVSGRMWIGQGTGALGVLDVAGGTVTVSGTGQSVAFQVSANGAATASSSGINITAGTLALSPAQTYVINTGNNNYSAINITGAGKMTTPSGAGFNLLNTGNANNITTISLASGGEWDTQYTFNNQTTYGACVINFNNGTMKATGTDGNGLIINNTAVYIYSGGATIDANGFNPKIAVPLLAPTGNGVTNISLGGTATGYIGAPLVKISSGGGKGAAAIATFDPTTGTITSITVTAPGSGYTSVPTVTLVGGNGGSTGSAAGTATGTATIGAVSSGGLTKSGNGALILNGTANTYTGDTLINQGRLQLTNAATLASSNITVASGATYDVSSISSYTLAANQNILGSGVVTGAVTTASTSKIYAGTDGTAGTLSFSNNLTMTAGSAFNLDVSTTASSGNDAVAVAGTLTLNTTALNIKAFSGAANLDTNADYVLVTAASISGNPNPAIAWVGTQPANAGNFSIVKSGNTLVLRYTAATPPVITSATANPATLARGQNTVITAAVTVGSNPLTSVTVSSAALLNSPVTMNSDGAGNYTNTVTIAANTALGSQTLAVVATDSASLAASSNIIVTVVAQNEIWSGGGGDNKWSTGANWTSGVQPGTGDAVTFAGSAQLMNNMDASVSVASLTFSNNAGSFTVTNAANTLTLTGGVTNNSTSAQTLDVPVALSGSQTISAASGDVTISRAVSGSALTKVGSGTLTLSGVNTYSGATTIGNGALTVGGAGQLGSGSYSATISDDGTLTFNSSASQTLSGVISGNGSLTQSGAGTLKLFAANTYTGNTTISGGTLTVGGTANMSLGIGGTVLLNGGTLSSDNNGAANFDPRVTNNITAGGGSIAGGSGTALHVAGNISGSAALGLSGIFNGSGLRLEGDDSGYSGTVTVTGANTRLGSATASSAAAAWGINGNLQTDVAGGATFNLGSLSGSGGISGHANNGSSTVSTLSVGTLNTSTDFSGTIANNALNTTTTGNADGAQNNVLALTKTGTGTLTLSGANTYTGSTTVSNGTLLVNGSLAAGSAVTIDGGTLGGTGTVGGAVTVNSGGTIAPGSSIGTLTLGSLTLNSGATTAMELGDSLSGDKAAATGAVAYNGTLKLIWTGTTPAAGTVDLFDGSSFAGAFSALQYSNWPSAYRINTNNLTTDGSIAIAANASPVAKNLTLGVAQGGSGSSLVIGGKNSATDADGDALSVTLASLVTPANGGNVSIVGGTSVVYTASSSFSGTDTFTYTVSDPFGATDTKTVTVMVAPASTGANITGISGSAPTITVQAQGIPNVVYQLQYATNLTTVNWVDVSGAGGTATAGTLSGAMTFTDANATNSQAWYRTRYVSGP